MQALHSPKFIPIGFGIPSWIPNLGWNSKFNADSNCNSKLNGWSVVRVLVAYSFTMIRMAFRAAFWNLWTLGLDFGPGNAGLAISAQKQTHKICCIHVLILDLCVSRLRILETVEDLLENFVCFWAEISIQSPAFPGPKHRSRVQRFQNAFSHKQTLSPWQNLQWGSTRAAAFVVHGNVRPKSCCLPTHRSYLGQML